MVFLSRFLDWGVSGSAEDHVLVAGEADEMLRDTGEAVCETDASFNVPKCGP